MSGQNIEDHFQNLSANAFPFVTSSFFTGGGPKQHTFGGFFGNHVIVKNYGATGDLYLGFSSAGVKTNKKYFIIAPSQSYSIPVSFASLWISGSSTMVSYSLAVGVTQIPTGKLSNWNNLV